MISAQEPQTLQVPSNMSDYKIEPLNGLLVKAASCRELVEIVAPLAERLLAGLGEPPARLFFVTQDGEDGLLTFDPAWFERLAPDERAYHVRRFCAARRQSLRVLVYNQAGTHSSSPFDRKARAEAIHAAG